MLDTIIIGLLIISFLVYGFWQYYVEPHIVDSHEKNKNEAKSKKTNEYAPKNHKPSRIKKMEKYSDSNKNNSSNRNSKRFNLKKRTEKTSTSFNYLSRQEGSIVEMNFSSNKAIKYSNDSKSSVQQDGESDVTTETSTSSDDSPKQKRTQRSRKTNQIFVKQRTVRNGQNGKTITNVHIQTLAARNINSIENNVYQQKYRALDPPLRQHTKLNLSEAKLTYYLRNYLLDEMLIRLLGFPVQCDFASNLAIIYKYPPYEFISQRKLAIANQSVSSAYYSGCPIFVNNHDGLASSANMAKENFGCEINDSDSGQGSGSSSPSSDVELHHASAIESNISITSSQKECSRCGKGFLVADNGDYVTPEPCLYHWGKINQFYDSGRMRRAYSCCGRDHSSSFNNGCTANRVHVWTGVNAGLNGPYQGFVKTKKRPGSPPKDGNTGVFALDCEMCYTCVGLELTKVTIVRSDGNLQYESFVRPDRDIVDYNTRFSGITEKDLNTQYSTRRASSASSASNSSSSSSCSNTNYRTVKSLQEVQNDLLKFIYEDTILIGHSIENDLKALKLIHKTIIDTAIAFPHYYGLPYRRSLKSLTKSILKRDIQTAENGHCSFEDSRACLELMLWKVRKDFREVLEKY